VAKPVSGFDPTEIFTATSMFFTKSQLQSINDLDKLLAHFTACKTKLPNVEFGSDSDKNIFESYLDPCAGEAYPSNDMFKDMMRGISAAIAIKDWLKGTYTPEAKSKEAQTVYMTGKAWPAEVAVFNIPVKGFSSYNSSDIIIKPVGMPKGYYGVSLKKKPKTDSPDPTMINKAFDTIFKDPPSNLKTSIDAMKADIIGVRQSFFAGLVRDAVTEGLIYLPSSETRKSDKDVFKGSKRTEYNMHKDRAWINTKGSLNMPEIIGPKDFTADDKRKYTEARLKGLYGLAAEDKDYYLGLLDQNKRIVVKSNIWNYYGDNTRALGKGALKSRTDTMRKWVNSKLGGKNDLYDGIMGVMNNPIYKNLIAETLVSVTMRPDILDEIKKNQNVKDLGEIDFGFALVTGVGDARFTANYQNTAISIPRGNATDIKCVIEGLAHMANVQSDKDWEFKITNRPTEESQDDDLVDDSDDGDGAAKIIFDLERKGKALMKMELRFKGGFTPQPQWFGVMSSHFKNTVLAGDCL